MKKNNHLEVGTEVLYLGLTLKIVRYENNQAVANYVNYTGQLQEFILTEDHLEIIRKDKIAKYPPYMNIRSIKNEI